MGSSPLIHVPGYEVIGFLGQGGMGTVYKARQVRLGRIVALKVLGGRLSADADYVRRFEREARLAARLSHPHIVAPIDAGRAGSVHFIAMEYVEGETCASLLARQGRLEEARALRIGLVVARALEHAREHDLVHRDVKPANILVTPEGTVKLCDLGLAKDLRRGSTTMTLTGILVGTPEYMAPEQGSPESDTRADVYSLGATLFHLLVGSLPFTGASALEVVMKQVTQSAPSPRAIRPELSEATSTLVLKAMEKEPEDRYATPGQMASAIEAAIAALSSPPSPAAPATSSGTKAHATGPARHPRARGFALAALSVVTVGAVLAWLSPGKTPKSSGPPPSPAVPVATAEPDLPPPPEPAFEPTEPDPDPPPGHASDPVEPVITESDPPPSEGDEDPGRVLVRLRSEAAAEAEHGNLAGAAAILDRFPASLSLTIHGRVAAMDAARYRRNAQAAWAGVLVTVDGHIAQGRFDEAATLLDAAPGKYGDSVGTEDLARRRQDIETGRGQAAAAGRAAAIEAYRTWREALHRLLEGRDYAKARALVEKALADAALSPVRDDLEADRVEVVLLEGLTADAERGARQLAKTGRKIRVARLGEAAQVEIQADQVMLRLEGGSLLRLDPESLDPADIITLAGAVLDGQEAETRLAYGLLLYHAGQAVKAKAEMEAAKAKGETRADRYLAWIREAEATAREAKAKDLSARGQASWKAGRHADAVRILTELMESYGDLPFVQEDAAAQRALAASGGPIWPHALDGVMSVRPRCLDRGVVEFTYDFSTAEQLRDWTPLAGLPVLGLDSVPLPGGWTVQDGRLGFTGQAPLVWKPALKGDVTLEFTLHPLEVKNLGVQLCDDGEGRAYRAAFLYRPGLGPETGDAWPLAGLARLDMTKVLYEDSNVEENDRNLRERIHRVLVGKDAAGVTAEKDNRVRVVRKADLLTVYVGEEKFLEARDRTLSGGRVALWVDTPTTRAAAAYWDDIRITGTIDPSWAAGVLR